MACPWEWWECVDWAHLLLSTIIISVPRLHIPHQFLHSEFCSITQSRWINVAQDNVWHADFEWWNIPFNSTSVRYRISHIFTTMCVQVYLAQRSQEWPQDESWWVPRFSLRTVIFKGFMAYILPGKILVFFFSKKPLARSDSTRLIWTNRYWFLRIR